ncbi:hypothetical protein AX774_g2254 [Zancudomyces culisetae]|uniref:Uncharacterized protein n=1 Tax=Zancudomyces culisetae TaxID=1213189 RepID=A0A1R1PTB2_ZANCU|nr:hypothetical protein AX774_g2254 [Zancudomyces culisetae]|eukprot:OMH84235.1 hypothetical protein AX774_g2254 [Zancudomyces culisetae]
MTEGPIIQARGSSIYLSRSSTEFLCKKPNRNENDTDTGIGTGTGIRAAIRRSVLFRQKSVKSTNAAPTTSTASLAKGIYRKFSKSDFNLAQKRDMPDNSRDAIKKLNKKKRDNRTKSTYSPVTNSRLPGNKISSK